MNTVVKQTEGRFVAKRVTRRYRQEIDGSPSDVFPLLCPVRERDWLYGWDCTMVYSESGYAEEGGVFTTTGAGGEADTIWLITRRDEESQVIQFARITPDSRAVKLDIAVSEREEGGSYVDIRYQVTALNEAGNGFIDGYSEEKFLIAMRFWERSMNHYMATGETLAPDEA